MQRSKEATQGRGVKMKPGQLMAKKLPDKGPTQKPFTGRVFYLDITSRLVAEKLEKDIKELGGIVEGFLSKEISCLITSKKEAKCAKSLKYQCSIPSPEPASGSSSARPSDQRGDYQDGGSSKKPGKEDVSRGKSLLKKVIKEQEIISKNSILANAMNWGVRILHLDDAKIYIDQKKRLLQPMQQTEKPDAPTKPVDKRQTRRQTKVQKLKSPFIKVEDSSCQYRPIFLVLPLFRSFQSTAKNCRPVANKPVAAPKQTEIKQNLNKTWHGQGQNEGNISPKLEERKRQGYCECCLQKYEDLATHLASPQHVNYGLGPYYQDVDNIITSFEFDFINWSALRPESQGPGLHIHASNDSPKAFSVKVLKIGVPLKEMKTATPPEVASPSGNNLVCHSEPIFTIPCTPQSVCSVTCVTDSLSKPPSSQVITPSYENVSPTKLPEPTNNSPDHNEFTQKDLHPKENESRLSETTPSDLNYLSDPVKFCPGKRFKLDDFTVETDNVSVPPPIGTTEPCKDVEHASPLQQSDTLCHLPPSSPTSKLHRKVKQLEQKARKQEELPCNSSPKVSVPLDECALCASRDRLESLFQSSDAPSEFYGFSCNSVDSLQCVEDMEQQPSSHGHILWSFFSHTSSSASTFYGF
ncbi:protein DBF4 homolog A isoform X2 [Ranitomeya variabilis]|uniref:protein DBF4 homolog A isoform X2 n=1 Tax=Ranitomeya variabilis TaxID=490064 RepID=UPI0040572ED4